MTTEEKDIYAIGEVPPLGFVPKKMQLEFLQPKKPGFLYGTMVIPSTGECQRNP